MNPAIKYVGRGVNAVLSPIGLRVVRSGHEWGGPIKFLPFFETLSEAKKMGLSVADYVDVAHNVKGATQQTIDEMDANGVFSGTIGSALEIGPGSGRYLEKVIKRCSPRSYEIYETAQPWADYLQRTYNVVLRPTNGHNLTSTFSDSIDLVQAHKVFVTTPFLITCNYWFEMVRVARSGGYIVFDVVTEDCMSAGILKSWLAEEPNVHSIYPVIMPREYAINFFRANGAVFEASFFIPMQPGRTEVLIFRKMPS